MRIQLSGVSKVIEGKTIIEKTDLTMQSGELCALIGPVGSGKTTLLNLILDVYKPTKGRVYYEDFIAEVMKNTWQTSKIFYIPNQPYFDSKLTLIENLEFLDRVYFPKSKMKQRKSRLLDILNRCEMMAYGTCRVLEISLPKLKQMAMVQGLMVEADVFILDEPFNGENTYHLTSEYIEQCKKRGSSLLIATSECSNVLLGCNRYIYIKEGRIVADGDYNRLLSQYKGFQRPNAVTDICEVSQMILE